MKILHLLSQNHLTGAEVYAATLARAQMQAGHQVFQVSNGFFYPSRATQIPMAVEVKSKLTFFKNVLSLRNFIKVENVQVIHTHSRAAVKLGYWATLGTKTALVSTVHGQQHASFSKKVMNQYGQFIIAVCENIKDHLVKDFNYRPQSIKVLRNPIDPQLFYSTPRPQKSEHLKVAIIGRTTGPKRTRTEVALRALGPRTEIHLVGGQKSELTLPPELLSRVHESHVDTLSSKEYEKYDVIIGSGRVCMEALLAGRPTIAFGEADYVGLVRERNFQQALASNFGDINLASGRGPVLNDEAFRKDLQTVLEDSEVNHLTALAQNEFSLQVISEKVQRLYESAIFLKQYPHSIPVLMYHKIPDQEINSPHKIFVLKEQFEKHLQFFKSRGFQTLTFSDLERFRRGQKPLRDFPKKPLILTFDDGYRDNLETASPLLKKYGFRAQIFLLADAAISHNVWDAQGDEPSHPIISGPDRQRWRGSAFEIGSHGFAHQKITLMSDEMAFRELSESKKALENELGIRVNAYAFTYGDTDERCARLAQQAGYSYAVNTDTGGFLIEESPYEIFRANIFPHETNFSLWKKTSRWYRRYYFRKRQK